MHSLKRKYRRVTLTGPSIIPSVLLEAVFRALSIPQPIPAHNFGGHQFTQAHQF